MTIIKCIHLVVFQLFRIYDTKCNIIVVNIYLFRSNGTHSRVMCMCLCERACVRAWIQPHADNWKILQPFDINFVKNYNTTANEK